MRVVKCRLAVEMLVGKLFHRHNKRVELFALRGVHVDALLTQRNAFVVRQAAPAAVVAFDTQRIADIDAPSQRARNVGDDQFLWERREQVVAVVLAPALALYRDDCLLDRALLLRRQQAICRGKKLSDCRREVAALQNNGCCAQLAQHANKRCRMLGADGEHRAPNSSWRLASENHVHERGGVLGCVVCECFQTFSERRQDARLVVPRQREVVHPRVGHKGGLSCAEIDVLPLRVDELRVATTLDVRVADGDECVDSCLG
jgi:hypothetical protein